MRSNYAASSNHFLVWGYICVWAEIACRVLSGISMCIRQDYNQRRIYSTVPPETRVGFAITHIHIWGKFPDPGSVFCR